MALPPFFDRVAAAASGTLLASSESLEALLKGLTPSVDILATDQNSRWIAELSVNLLARLFPRIAICGESTLTDGLRDIAASINKDIEFADAPSDASIQLRLHPDWGGEARHEVWARADGWVATLSDGPIPIKDQRLANPYASGAAACLAVGEIIRRAFRKPRLSGSAARRVSLLDFSETGGADLPLDPAGLAQVAFVGLGAVGNGALWALGRHEKVQGEVLLVDDERVELSNLQRYVLTTRHDVDLPKTKIAERALSRTALTVRGFAVELARFADQFGETFPVPTLAVSVDNIEARRAAQALLPRLVVNAFTGMRSLGSSWHRLDSNRACLACLYHPIGQVPSQTDLIAKAFGLTPTRTALILAGNATMSTEEAKAAAKKLGASKEASREWTNKPLSELYVSVVCGGAELPIPGRGHSEVVPLAHQSALAGIFLAAELVKRLTPSLELASQSQTLAAWHDVLRLPPKGWAEPRLRVAGCICGDAIYQDTYREKWAGVAST